jgi:hypothetical protein
MAAPILNLSELFLLALIAALIGGAGGGTCIISSYYRMRLLH